MGKNLGEEWVFLHLENGQYYGLNETGSLVWDELGKDPDKQAAISRLQKIFGIDRAVIERDVEGFLKELSKAGLIQVEDLAA